MRKSKLIVNSLSTLLVMNLVIPLSPFQIYTNERYNVQAAERTKESTQAVIDRLTKNLHAYYGETSIQYAIIDHDKIVYSGSAGYADKKQKKAPKDSTMYCSGSVSKIYTTTAVMQLVEKGLIKLDEPITTYIEDFKMADERYQDITVRMLLNHSSGLKGSTLNNCILYNDIDQTTKDNLLELLKDDRLSFKPGELSVYCNDGFTLAEILVERVTGMSFTSYIHKNILTPLGTKDTNASNELFVTSKLAKIYANTGEELPREVLGIIGAGGIYTSARDLCTFARTFMNESNGILTKESVDAMAQNESNRGIHIEDDGASISYGLGWDNVYINDFEQYGIKALQKGGDTIHYHSGLTVLPEENIAIAIMSVGGSSVYNNYVGKEILLSYLEEKGRIDRGQEKVSNFLESKAKESMPVELVDYSGYYGSINGVMKIDIEDGHLQLSNVGIQDTMDFLYVYDGWFYDKSTKTGVHVGKEKNGNVYIYMNGISTYNAIGEDDYGYYMGQKLADYDVSKDVLDSWIERSDESYLLVSEKYSSYTYYDSLPVLKVDFKDYMVNDQYAYNYKFVDSIRLIQDYQIPMMYGRDLIDLTITNQDGIEYINQNDYKFINESYVKKLSKKSKFSVTLGKDGQSRYYKIPQSYGGKKLHIELPKKSGFVVYNEAGNVVTSSYLKKTKNVTLPKGGYIVFIGDAGAKFDVSYMK